MKRLMFCPFCGEEEKLEARNGDYAGLFFTFAVCCDNCDTTGPEETSSDRLIAKDAAINRWNERLPHDQDLALRTAFRMEG